MKTSIIFGWKGSYDRKYNLTGPLLKSYYSHRANETTAPFTWPELLPIHLENKFKDLLISNRFSFVEQSMTLQAFKVTCVHDRVNELSKSRVSKMSNTIVHFYIFSSDLTETNLLKFKSSTSSKPIRPMKTILLEPDTLFNSFHVILDLV